MNISLPTDRFRLPISIRLTIWYGFSMIVLLSLFAGVLAAAMHFNQHMLLHQRLFSMQADLLPNVETSSESPTMKIPLDSLSSAFYTAGPLGTYVRLVSREGRVLYRSPNFGDQPEFEPSPPDSEVISEQTRVWADQPVRVMYAPVLTRAGRLTAWLEISAHSPRIARLIPGMSLLYAILFCAALALLGGYLLARHALKPVGSLALAAGAIGPGDLGARLPVSGRYQDELSDLSEVFNRMLDRLEAAFERERRFTADAAHEIMNPLASMRNEAEIALRQPRSETEYRLSLEAILDQSRRLSKTARQLLEIARLESETVADQDSTDFSQLVLDRIALLEKKAVEKSLTLAVYVEPDLRAVGNELLMGMVVDNLLENAFKYTPSSGQITIRLQNQGHFGTLTIEDTGAGFDPAIAERLFERFYRAEDVSIRSLEGVGLGLSVVHSIVESLGGSVQARSGGAGMGSAFIVTLPLAKRK